MILTHKDRGRFESFFWQGSAEECWQWLGGKDRDGYGKFRIGKEHLRAHRVTYFLEYGQFDESMNVLHSCDNPPCVNPLHLFLGTALDNTKDMIQKNRHNFGCFGKEMPNNVEVETIIQLYKSRRYNQKQLAEMFGISSQAVSMYVTGERRSQ